MNKAKGFVNIIIVVVVLVVLGGVGWYAVVKKNQPATDKLCTTEALVCPDGSSVGRSGPSCEFAQCLGLQDETANWKIYENAELSLSFRYPQEWEDVNVNIREGLSDAYPEGKGRVILVSFTNGPISLAAYTADFAGYAQIPYRGDKNLATLCEKPLVVEENTDKHGHVYGVSYCNKITVDGKPVYNQISVVTLPEGDGSFQLTQNAIVNLQGRVFKGLKVSQYFPEVASELNTGEVHARKVYLEKILARQVPQSVLDRIDIFEQFVGTFKFQN